MNQQQASNLTYNLKVLYRTKTEWEIERWMDCEWGCVTRSLVVYLVQIFSVWLVLSIYLVFSFWWSSDSTLIDFTTGENCSPTTPSSSPSASSSHYYCCMDFWIFPRLWLCQARATVLCWLSSTFCARPYFKFPLL